VSPKLNYLKWVAEIEPPVTDNLSNYSMMWNIVGESKHFPKCKDRDEEDC